MRITCLNGHDVCTCPDGIGWSLDADNFTDYAPGQYQITQDDRVWHIMTILVYAELESEHEPLAGQCWCGMPWGGKDHRNRFIFHTKEYGWWPKYDTMPEWIDNTSLLLPVIHEMKKHV